ncbi:MAG: hypothetical protein KDD62_08690 [Bdellovibrionales bacterium]|nr:hypothetical protein [Bdellovibrionales bacterium]
MALSFTVNRELSSSTESDLSLSGLQVPQNGLGEISEELRSDRQANLREQVHSACDYLRELEPEASQLWGKRELSFAILLNIVDSVRKGDEESLRSALEALGRNCSAIGK